MLSAKQSNRADRGILKKRLALADRMTAVGLLAAGAAHEIAAPLGAIVASLDRLRRAVDQAIPLACSGGHACGLLCETLRAAADAIADAQVGARDASTIVRDLEEFSRPAREPHVAIELQTVVYRAVRLVSPMLPKGTRVITDFRDTPFVRGSESHLTQVFVDLLLNAGQAMTASPRGPDDVVTVGVWSEGDEVIAEVRDTGEGIPEELMPCIFEPFFTTKPPEAGSGLGLWICRQVISAHKGRIGAESAAGRGTRVRVCLPALRHGGRAGLASGEGARNARLDRR